MRSGVCALQQTLTAEAASVLKHSVGLAKRRGHAQVTPLHVAATLLTSRASLLRRACLKSHHHNSNHNHQNIHHQPLQCRALELCFNVALNRLPTTGGPLLHSHHQPSLSNALIAALKRAQAHQRRGSIEQQQHHQQAQPLLTIKVELEQLIISILDDPSVSRVMREAGFSSTTVKNNLEEDTSSASMNNSVFLSPSSSTFLLPNFWHTHLLSYSSDQNPLLFSPPKGEEDRNHTKFKDDIMVVFDVLLRKKKRNTVIVGDSVSVTEGLVAELMGRFERGDVPEELRRTHFVKFQFSPISLKLMKREDVERNLLELKRKVDCLVSGREGVIIYTGDLKWTIVDGDDDHHDHHQRSDGPRLVSSCYSPADHVVTEISRLIISKPKVWIMATASYQTYMKCQMRETPLEIQWALQAVAVPSGGLGLSLHAAAASSVHDSRIMFSQSPETKPLLGSKDEILQDYKLTCCSECASHCDKEAQLLKSGHQKLPAWLQPQCGTQPHQKDELVELRRKWSRLCHSLHQGKQSQSFFSSTLQNNNQISLIGNKSTSYNSYSYTSSYPWWPTQNTIFQDSNSISFADPTLKPAGHDSGLAPGRFRRQQSCTIEFNFDGDDTRKPQKHQEVEPRLDFLRSSRDKEVKITLALGNSVFSDSVKWEDHKIERSSQRAEMCKVLKENVPWQSETIPSIMEAMIVSESAKRETCWLLIPGNDMIGKRRLARAIAESVLGSADLLLQLNTNLNNQKNGNAESPESDQLVLSKALKTHKKLVVLVEDIESADIQLIKFLADGFESGKFGEADLGQVIFILTKGETTIHENEMKNKDSVIQMTFNISETMTAATRFEALKFDRKRKATEWELPNKELAKNPRMEEKKKALSRQSSFNTLDLNVKAEEDDDDDDDGGGGSEDKPGELSPISSDLTRETATTELRNPSTFVESIENIFVFNRSPAREREMIEVFESKMKERFGEIWGKQNVVSFSVEERVLDEVCFGSGCFSNSLFEKWVKDVFQTALKTVRFSGKESGGNGGGGVVRLCLGGKEEGILEDGFMGSCLPSKIQVSYKD